MVYKGQTEARRKASAKYLASLDEIRIRVPSGKKEIIKNYAESKGMSMNQFIISLIEKEIESNSEIINMEQLSQESNSGSDQL